MGETKREKSPFSLEKQKREKRILKTNSNQVILGRPRKEENRRPLTSINDLMTFLTKLRIYQIYGHF